MSTVITWLVRWGHIASAAVWVGGYALVALAIVPALMRGANDALRDLAITAVRVGTYAGTLTIGFGIVLITRTRGFANLFGSEWGSLVLLCFVSAIALLGIGDGALRPALNRLVAGGEGRAARRWAFIGFGLTVLTIGMMTRAVYAR